MKKLYHISPWKRLLFLLPAFIFFGKAHAQPIVVNADPAVVSFDITDLNDISVPALSLVQGRIYKLKFNILNLSQQNAIPDHTAIPTIGLGSKLILDPAFILSNAPYNNYFQWLSQTSGGQVQIAGILHTALPADFDGILVFNVKANVSGGSTITGNFNVSNNNPSYTLTDDNPNNNSTSLIYLIAAQSPLPVTLTKFTAVKTDCSIKANWSVENEINFDRYELQVSKDGVNFSTISTVSAQNNRDYNSSFSITNLQQANFLKVRLKMIDKDGSFKYSNIVSVSGNCNGLSQTGFYGYPNPVTRDVNAVTIANREGLFNGTYQLTLSDISGKVYSVKEILLNNISSFRFDVSQLTTSGKYAISIHKKDGTENGVIQFLKL